MYCRSKQIRLCQSHCVGNCETRKSSFEYCLLLAVGLRIGRLIRSEFSILYCCGYRSADCEHISMDEGKVFRLTARHFRLRSRMMNGLNFECNRRVYYVIVRNSQLEINFESSEYPVCDLPRPRQTHVHSYIVGMRELIRFFSPGAFAFALRIAYLPWFIVDELNWEQTCLTFHKIENMIGQKIAICNRYQRWQQQQQHRKLISVQRPCR